MKPQKKVIFVDPDDAGRLHCDACHYNLPDRLTWGAHLIGHPCPECGADMLTVRDYQSTEKMFRWIDRINRWFGPLFGRYTPGKDGVSVGVKIHDDSITVSKREQEQTP